MSNDCNDSNMSYVFDIDDNVEHSGDKDKLSTKLTEPSVVLLTDRVEVVNIATQTDVTKENQQPKPESVVQRRYSCLSISDSEDEVESKKKKTVFMPKCIVLLEQLPADLCNTEKSVLVYENQSLLQFYELEEELWAKTTVRVTNLFLHGETSRSKRIQEVHLRRRSQRKDTRRASPKLTSSSGDGNIRVGLKKKNKTYCAFCGDWVFNIKIHRKEHDALRFTCDVCGKQYKMKTHLSQHVRRVHSDIIL